MSSPLWSRRHQMDVLCRALLANHRVQEVAIDSMPTAVDDANEEALGR